MMCYVSIQAWFLMCKLSRPPAAKVQENGYLRIQGRMQFFKRMSQKALNRVLTLPDDSTRRAFLKSSGIIDLKTIGFVNHSNTVNL